MRPVQALPLVRWRKCTVPRGQSLPHVCSLDGGCWINRVQPRVSKRLASVHIPEQVHGAANQDLLQHMRGPERPCGCCSGRHIRECCRGAARTNTNPAAGQHVCTFTGMLVSACLVQHTAKVSAPWLSAPGGRLHMAPPGHISFRARLLACNALSCLKECEWQPARLAAVLALDGAPKGNEQKPARAGLAGLGASMQACKALGQRPLQPERKVSCTLVGWHALEGAAAASVRQSGGVPALYTLTGALGARDPASYIHVLREAMAGMQLRQDPLEAAHYHHALCSRSCYSQHAQKLPLQGLAGCAARCRPGTSQLYVAGLSSNQGTSRTCLQL